jgi:hypothetical protein
MGKESAMETNRQHSTGKKGNKTDEKKQRERWRQLGMVGGWPWVGTIDAMVTENSIYRHITNGDASREISLSRYNISFVP